MKGCSDKTGMMIRSVTSPCPVYTGRSWEGAGIGGEDMDEKNKWMREGV